MLSAVIPSERSQPAMHLAVQLAHQRFVHPGPLVLGTALLKFPAREDKKREPRLKVSTLFSQLIPATTYSPTDTLRSTIGDERLNCQVRHGTGWDPLSIITGNFI